MAQLAAARDVLPALRAVRPGFDSELVELGERAARWRRDVEAAIDARIRFDADRDRATLEVARESLLGYSEATLGIVWPALLGRVGMGLHYLVVNIVSSLLFLVGVAMIYGVAGTLNMADLARRFMTLSPDARTLFDIGAAILGIAFLIKAGSWPLNFWLPGTYSAAIAPVGAAFAMLTKVGVYALMRVGTLMSEDDAAASMLGMMMFYFGLATLLTGTIGMLASHHLARLVSYSLVASTGSIPTRRRMGWWRRRSLPSRWRTSSRAASMRSTSTR